MWQWMQGWSVAAVVCWHGSWGRRSEAPCSAHVSLTTRMLRMLTLVVQSPVLGRETAVQRWCCCSAAKSALLLLLQTPQQQPGTCSEMRTCVVTDALALRWLASPLYDQRLLLMLC